jgi:hypothetical protein
MGFARERKTRMADPLHRRLPRPARPHRSAGTFPVGDKPTGVATSREQASPGHHGRTHAVDARPSGASRRVVTAPCR